MPRAKTRPVLPALLILLAGWLPACDQNDDQEPETHQSSTAAKSNQCRTLLGTSGVAWVAKNTPAKIVESDHEVNDLDVVEQRYPSDARYWSPGKDEGSTIRFPPDVCRLTPAGMESDEQMVRVRFGTSPFPYDEVDPEDMDKSEVTDVNKDVRLVSWERDGRRPKQFTVYVKCHIKLARDGQETRLPLEGRLTDNLTRDQDNKEEHFNFLLHAARYFVDKLDCTNAPRVPAKAPAA